MHRPIDGPMHREYIGSYRPLDWVCIGPSMDLCIGNALGIYRPVDGPIHRVRIGPPSPTHRVCIGLSMDLCKRFVLGP